jgi:imidazolonepropionase-like amidohydrolase
VSPRIGRRALLGGAAALVASEALGQPRPAAKKVMALAGGTLLRHDAAPLENSVVVVEDGKVVYVGDDKARAAGAELVDTTGRTVTAGLVDALTQIGVVEVDLETATRDGELDSEDLVRAAFMTADGYNPASVVVRVTRREGITSVGVIPKEGLVTGQSAWADLDGDVPEQALARRSLALHIDLDDAIWGSFGKSRGTAMLRLRELFDDARAYSKNKGAYEKRQVRELGASRLDYEVVVKALDGKLPVVFHVDRAADILGALQLAKDNGLKMVLASAAEGWKVASEIATAGVGAIVYPLDEGPRSFAALGAREDNAALLQKAGVTVALSTGESHNARKLRQEAGNAVRAGLPAQAALAAVTEAPARLFGMDDYGTPAVGRVANLVVWTGDPFELGSFAEHVVIRGRDVDLRSRQTALYDKYRSR